MTFNSFAYFLFLPLVYLAFYFTAHRWRWLLLLIASYGFYASFNAPYLLAVLLGVTTVSYYCGLKIASHNEESARKRWLWLGIFSCVATLAVVKFLPFLGTHASSIFGLYSISSTAFITIGVSYFTFQAISYLADIYLEITEPEHHFGRFALYMAFFPKLLQGPIERAEHLIPQLEKTYKFDYAEARFGITLIMWGVFQKIVLANMLALYADQVFNHITMYDRFALLLGVYAFALQIFFDFAGYTDVALGTGYLFGIRLTNNFNSPYLAQSVADFWRRWHISFSRWIFDYIFKPMQMEWRNLGRLGTAAALLLTFLVSGIWHGLTLGFVIWGVIHGIYLSVGSFYQPYKKRLHKWLGVETSRWFKYWQIFVTFNLVSFAWIFFRAGGKNGWELVKKLFRFDNLNITTPDTVTRTYDYVDAVLSQGKYNAALLVVMLMIIGCMNIYKNKVDMFAKPFWFRWSIYFILVLGTCLFAQPGDNNFLYFRF